MFAGLEDRVRVGSLLELEDYLKENTFDFVSSIDTPEIFPIYRRAGLPPLILEVHTTYGSNLAYLSRVRASPVRGIVVPSQAQAELVRRRIGPSLRLRIAPTPLSREFAETPISSVARPPRPVICWVGRIDDHKNWKGFLRVVSLVRRRYRDIELLMVGRPAEPEIIWRLQKKAQDLGLLRALRWLPGIPHALVPRVLDSVALSGGAFLSTSRDESFGMAIAEAMARSCVAVVPAKPPFNELVQNNKTGVCYTQDSLEDAADNLLEVIRDPGRAHRMGEAARKSILAQCREGVALTVLKASFEDLTTQG